MPADLVGYIGIVAAADIAVVDAAEPFERAAGKALAVIRSQHLAGLRREARGQGQIGVRPEHEIIGRRDLEPVAAVVQLQERIYDCLEYPQSLAVMAEELAVDDAET